MSKTTRKQLRLQDYDYSQNNAYFVTICINNRERVLGNIVGSVLQGHSNNPHLMVERWLLEMNNKFTEAFIDYYAIMPNHLHFILFIEAQGGHAGPPLPDMVAWFKTMTTNEYIRGVKASRFPPFNKRLWQRGYYEHIIRNVDDLFNCRKYIQENPLKWREDELYTE